MRLIRVAVTLALGLLALGLALGPHVVEAQQAGKVWRIGLIVNSYLVADAMGPNPPK